MNNGIIGSHMVSNGSSSGGGQSVFTLDSQTAVLRLLSAIRNSDLAAADKNELRDLVFLYVNGGHDESVRLTLEKKIAAHKLEIPAAPAAVKEAPAPAAPRPTIGTFRSAPQFRVPTPPVSVATPEPVATADTTPTKAVPEPVPPAPVSSTPPPPPVPAPQPVAEVVPPAPVEPVSKTSTTLEPAAPPAAPTLENEDVLVRIREIKAAVNEKVGNPVHLMDIDPAVGREYMSALLEAMKKATAGAVATGAMARLETAYQAVVALDLTRPAATTTDAPAPPVEPASSNVNAAERTVPVADLDRVVSSLTPPPTPTPAEPAPVPAAEPKRVPVTSTPIVETPAYDQAPVSGFAQTSISTPQSARVGDSQSIPITSSNRTSFATESQAAASAPVKPPVAPLGALPTVLPKKPEPAPSVAPTPTDPLHTAEVDAGLEQLLDEWPLFKKSGLFGTGPKGREHPLFKRIAGLQIPLLLAGRFEGATQEIKQSITDYMNGWRYEQGIIYEQGETFEHYLRRVIKHILDLQKNRR